MVYPGVPDLIVYVVGVSSSREETKTESRLGKRLSLPLTQPSLCLPESDGVAHVPTEVHNLPLYSFFVFHLWNLNPCGSTLRPIRWRIDPLTLV